MNKKGKFIVIEGLDGSGKSTQTKLLEKRLKEEGYKVKRIDFPQYGKKSAGLVEEYLNGKYGSAKEVGPYRASIFYACDRYNAGFKIKEWLREGKIVISDRYTASNAGHQGGKIKEKKEREKFFKWLFDLEYGIFEIPKPDIILFLKTSADFSLKLSSKITDKEKKQKKMLYLGKKKRDIHEKDKKHLVFALSSYLQFGKKFKKEFKIIECLENGKLLSIEEIHKYILNAIKKHILEK